MILLIFAGFFVPSVQAGEPLLKPVQALAFILDETPTEKGGLEVAFAEQLGGDGQDILDSTQSAAANMRRLRTMRPRRSRGISIHGAAPQGERGLKVRYDTWEVLLRGNGKIEVTRFAALTGAARTAAYSKPEAKIASMRTVRTNQYSPDVAFSMGKESPIFIGRPYSYVAWAGLATSCATDVLERELQREGVEAEQLGQDIQTAVTEANKSCKDERAIWLEFEAEAARTGLKSLHKLLLALAAPSKVADENFEFTLDFDSDPSEVDETLADDEEFVKYVNELLPSYESVIPEEFKLPNLRSIS